MALVQCSECDKEVSSNAMTCPHCGFTLKKGNGCLGWLIGIPMVVLLLGLLHDMGGKSSSSSVKPCDFYRADDLVKIMLKEGVFSRIDEGDGFPRIYVSEAWYHVPFEQKVKLDAILQCHFGRGAGDKLGSYRDYRSGKEVATTGGGLGFKMD